MNLPSSRTYGAWLALVRILTGCIWLIHAVPKFTKAGIFLPPTGIFATYVQDGIGKTTGPYHDFLINTVSSNMGLFAELVRIGELGVGLSLFFGLFTRLGGFFGVLLPLNYLAARGALGTPSGWSATDGCLMLLSAICLVLPTGRVAGVDALAARRVPRRQRVVPEVVPERPMDGPRAPA
jgi:uncharacterized membrane protein YphA (DoxX/SURF4 family)